MQPLFPDFNNWPFDDIIMKADTASPWRAVEISSAIMFYTTGMTFWVKLLAMSDTCCIFFQNLFGLDNKKSTPMMLSYFLNVALVHGKEFANLSQKDQVLLTCFAPVGAFSLGDHFAY